MKPEDYKEAAIKHVDKDEEVSWESIPKEKARLN
jgi:hypothetical protein